MAPVLHERVLAVRGFGDQGQIGLIVDECTKALSKNRVIVDGQDADRCGGNGHASSLVAVRADSHSRVYTKLPSAKPRSRDSRRPRYLLLNL
jgi:hypothetical protein